MIKKIILKIFPQKVLLLILMPVFLYSPMGFSQDANKKSLRAKLSLVDSCNIKYNTVTATVHRKNNSYFVYTGGDKGYINAFSMTSKGKLLPLETYELNMYNKKRGPTRGLITAQIAGTDFLFAGNKGGNAVEVFRIDDQGKLEQVFALKDTEETHLGTVITLRVIHMEKASYLFVGGLEKTTPGLSCFKIESSGKLIHVQSLKDNDKIHTDGIIGMYSHTINGKTFLFTGGFQDNGVSSFRVYQNGSFKNVSNISDNTIDRYLTGAYPVDGVSLGDNHYVIVGHRHHKYYKRTNFIKKKDFVYHGDGLSVFKINQKGKLIPHDVLVDDHLSKLSGQTRIEIFKLNNQEALVAVATRDDESIQICMLDKEGILTPLGSLPTGYSIYYGLASQQIDQSLFLIAGSNKNNPQQLFSYKVALKKNSFETTKVLRHIVNFKFKAEVSPAQIKQAVKNFEGLQNKIPEIIDFEWGINNSKEGHSKGFTHCFILSFKDEEARKVYLFHKNHLALVEKVKPLLEDVFVMDYWTRD